MTKFPPALAVACAGRTEVDLPAGSELITEGAAGGKLFLLIEGAVKVMRSDVEVARIDEPGALFGEMSLLLGIPQTATVITTSQSRFWAIEDGAAFLRANPEAMLHVSKTLALRVHLLSGYLADLKTQFAEHGDHLGMLHEVACGLCEHPHTEVTLGWDRQSTSGS